MFLNDSDGFCYISHLTLTFSSDPIMLFNSIDFLVFLSVVFLLYWFAFNRSLRLQNLFVVVASYVFYGWWDWRFLILIAFTSFCSWGSGLLIKKAGQNHSRAKYISIANIVLNLLILGVFKYYDFFVTSFATMFEAESDGLLLNIILPVGISFYTFQALSYSIDVYRHKIEPTHDLIEFFAFVSFFPQLVAGPIERATNLLPQFQRKRVFDYETAVDGVRQMLWGFFKKIVVADNCAEYVDAIWNNYSGESGSTLFLAAILFAFQIYGDFSGYSDIAIGTSKLFGIRLMRNFKMPYFSRDIAEFWRRWHISLNTWFRDYVYIPLGGSRVSKSKVIRNTFVIFLLSGLWHGANWTYVAWGTYHAILFLPLVILGMNRKFTDEVSVGRILPTLREFVQMTTTFLLVVIGWIIFRAPSIRDAASFMSGMANASLFTCPSIPSKTICFVLILLLVEWLQRFQEHGLVLSHKGSWCLRYMSYTLILILIFCFGVFHESFIYFQF